MTVNRKGRKYGMRREPIELSRLIAVIPTEVKSKADAAADTQGITLAYYVETALREKLERESIK